MAIATPGARVGDPMDRLEARRVVAGETLVLGERAGVDLDLEAERLEPALGTRRGAAFITTPLGE